MRQRWLWVASLLLGPPSAGAWEPLAVQPLRVTEGRGEPLPGGGLRVEKSRLRAVALGEPGHAGATASPQEVELRLLYRGASREQRPLQSGEPRRQVGLKLRAQDGCNVVYVMWRIAPRAELVVSVKHNPALHRSADCGNQGYQTVKPLTRGPLPALEPGTWHTLRARLRGARLDVWVDGVPSWEGTLPAEALSFEGPVGLRTDNGRFDVELRAAP